VAVLSGKWVKVPANDTRFADLAGSLDKESFIAGMTSQDSGSGELRNLGPASVNGTQTTRYASSKGSELYIAAAGPPVIFKIFDPSNTGGTLTFSD
jgi:hypothetical protein